MEGLRALDRYTFQIKLADPSPRFLYNFADGSFTGAQAREVVEFYGDKIGEHPVGTGPYRLAQWKRSSRIVLEKSPSYREVFYDETPPPGDARLAADAARLKGRRLPLLDRVVISIIEEPQPRWLSFLNEEQDVMDQLPADFATTVIPNNELAPNLKKRGITMVRYPRADVSMSYFAMENPVVGGYEPHKVALRRAIALSIDLDREIRLVRRGQAIPGQSAVAPMTFGYDPDFKSEMSEYNLPRAKALLDLHGYVDRNGDGWREQPDGQPLVLEYATQPDQQSRQLIEQWKKNMDALGVRIEFKTAKWPENLKSSRAGKLGLGGRRTRRRHLPGTGLRAQQGAGQPFAIRPAGLQPALPEAARDARRGRAPGGVVRREEADGGLHAHEDPRAPRLHRPGASVGGGLPPQHLRA